MDLLVRRLARVMTKISDPGAQQRAARAAGHVIAGGCAPTDADFLVDALFKLAGTKSEETRIAVGEALCFAFGGVGVTAEGALFGSFVSLAELTEKTSVERCRADLTPEAGSAGDKRFFAGTDAFAIRSSTRFSRGTCTRRGPRSDARRARGSSRSFFTPGGTRGCCRCSPRFRRRSGACWAIRTS